ncbi:unnamed protein product, partial [Tilletia caries]
PEATRMQQSSQPDATLSALPPTYDHAVPPRNLGTILNYVRAANGADSSSSNVQSTGISETQPAGMPAPSNSTPSSAFVNSPT